MKTIRKMSPEEFVPRMPMAERYSLENMAKRRGLSVKDFKLEIDRELKEKQDMINKRLSKGYTQEQAENEALRCLYIAGFCGPTFK